MVVVLPLALGGLAAAIRVRFVAGTRRIVRSTRSGSRTRRAGRAQEP